jgi:hypothetical protein
VTTNPCVKTGCLAIIAGWIWRGDLFDLGDYLLLNCSAGPSRDSPEGLTFHLHAETWEQVLQREKVVLIRKTTVIWFDYDGNLLDEKGCIVVA